MKKISIPFLFIAILFVVVGVVIGFFISSKFNLIPASITEMSSPLLNKSPDISRLSSTFTKIADKVIPAVVSISAQKIVVEKNSSFPFEEEDLFEKFLQKYEYPDDENTNNRYFRKKEWGLGSGVIIDSKKGFIVTNNHVISGSHDITVTLFDRRSFKASIIGTDVKTDLAVIKLKNASSIQEVNFGDSNKLKIGEWVLAIGSPFGLRHTVTAGIISAEGRANIGISDFEDFLQTDAAINPGNSGGALVNLYGEVIGINTAIASKTGGYVGIGFAIPSNMVSFVAKELIKHGKVIRSQLGIIIQQITPELAHCFNLKNINEGIIIGDVIKGTGAYEAKLKIGDVIIKLNDSPVNDINKFRNIIALTKPGTEVKLDILRDNKPMTIKVKLKQAIPEKEVFNNTTLKPSKSGKLGFEVDDISPELIKKFKIDKNEKGIIITNIDTNSSAYLIGGLKPGDIIKEVNRKEVNSVFEFKKYIKGIKPGDTILLLVKNGENTIFVAFVID